MIPSRAHARLLGAAFVNDTDNQLGHGYGVLFLRTPAGLVNYWKLTDEQRAAVGLDDEIFEAIRQEGWLIPQTVEEVLAAERQLASEHIEVPHYLAKPPALRGQRPLSIVKPRASSSFAQDTQENLARAARNGVNLPPEVEERMR